MPVLGYWKLRGYAQPIRLMLGYLEIDFEDKMYEVGEGPEFSREAWESEKYSLGNGKITSDAMDSLFSMRILAGFSTTVYSKC